MSFYSDLDDNGKKLYDDYIKASDAWTEYCRPKVFSNFNDYLNKTNRKFYCYEYYTNKYNKNKDDIDKNDIDKDDDEANDNKKIYKILSKKLHPDRFKKLNADKFFAMINKASYNNNDTFLQEILEKLDKIINFTDEELDDFIDNINKKDLESTNNNELFNSIQYKLFCNPTYKKEINNYYMTEEELIKEIETHYDYSFVEFYANKYKDNENIQKACIIRMEKENKKLIEKNEYLRNKLEELRKT